MGLLEEVMAKKPKGVGINRITRQMLRDLQTNYAAELDDSHLENSGVLPDWAIRELVTIDGFVDYDQCPAGTISYGLTSAGYDIRVGHQFKVFTNARCATVDPKKMKSAVFKHFDLTGHRWATVPNAKKPICVGCKIHRDDAKARLKCVDPNPKTRNYIKIPPNSFALAETVETLYIPKNVVCWCIGKSTYARCGINMNFTPFEPGWWGVVTVEIINATPLPVKIYAGEGIGQAEFFLMAGTPQKSYADKKNAKYQGQTGLTLPTVK